ncbi:hypothetical protein BGZ73_003193 [Actinomortierella ambigua]|nr:hypothetical protein BGZ73_003193 [Actinomortierella ambigua]
MSFPSLQTDYDDDDFHQHYHYQDREGHPFYSSTVSSPSPITAHLFAGATPFGCPATSYPPSPPSLSMSTGEEQSPFRVIIVGGNIAGLMLGCFLQMHNIDFVILERELQDGLPRSPIILGSFVMNLLEMVGLVEETIACSCPMMSMHFWSGSTTECESLGFLDFSEAEEKYAYSGRGIEYTDLQRILLSPIHSQVLDKQTVVQFTQRPHQVDVKCSDNTIHTGTILVGADGYDSIIRRLLYDDLAQQPIPQGAVEHPLSPSDLEPFGTNCCISGSTYVLDREDGLFPKFYEMSRDKLESHVISGADVPFCWWMTLHPHKQKVSWMITYDQPRDKSPAATAPLARDDIHKPDLVHDFLEHMRPLQTPFGGAGTLGDLIDRTDPQSIQRFNRCGKIWQTWYHQRVVLLGDGKKLYAARRLVPYAGQGALQAMLDAHALSHAIALVKNADNEPIERALDVAFAHYHVERYDYTRDAVKFSRQFAELIGNPVSQRTARPPFRAIIVGAGLGGLLLALQLERSHIDYVVVERNNQVLMPLEGGGVIFVQKAVRTLLDQLGLLDDVLQAAGAVDKVLVKEFSHGQETRSRDTLAITRPELYNILVQRVPPAKLHVGKTVERIEQDEQSVRCYCAEDASSFVGDILVGADGVYSAVRLHILRQLRDQGALSTSDQRRMQSDCIRLVGQATELDLSAFAAGLAPQPRQGECHVQVAVYKGDPVSYTTWAVMFPKGNVCWMIDQHLQEPEDCPDLEDLTYHADLVEAMRDKFRDLPSAWGPSVPHDIFFQATLPNTMGRLGRETKVLDAWHLGRLVLMGDACHKALPYWGDPFAQAALDSIALHKALQSIALQNMPEEDMTGILEGYVSERIAEAKRAAVSSRKFEE